MYAVLSKVGIGTFEWWQFSLTFIVVAYKCFVDVVCKSFVDLGHGLDPNAMDCNS